MSDEPTLYETMYILSTELGENEVEEQVQQIEEVVREAGGEVVRTSDFRTRRLTYEIDGHTHGSYRLLYFHGGDEVIGALKTDLAMRETVIRARVFVANPEALVGEPSEEQEEADTPATAAQDEGPPEAGSEAESAAEEASDE